MLHCLLVTFVCDVKVESNVSATWSLKQKLPKGIIMADFEKYFIPLRRPLRRHHLEEELPALDVLPDMWPIRVRSVTSLQVSFPYILVGITCCDVQVQQHFLL